MKSIKPGRGPSGMSFIGSIAAIIFGVFWTIIAASITSGMGAFTPFGSMGIFTPFRIMGIIFPLFGVLFIILGIVQAVYNYKNATGKNRYSVLDITDSSEEGDPSDKWIKDRAEDEREKEKIEYKEQQKSSDNKVNYCPYCGVQLDSDYVYCPKCGKAKK